MYAVEWLSPSFMDWLRGFDFLRDLLGPTYSEVIDRFDVLVPPGTPRGCLRSWTQSSLRFVFGKSAPFVDALGSGPCGVPVDGATMGCFWLFSPWILITVLVLGTILFVGAFAILAVLPALLRGIAWFGAVIRPPRQLLLLLRMDEINSRLAQLEEIEEETPNAGTQVSSAPSFEFLVDDKPSGSEIRDPELGIGSRSALLPRASVHTDLRTSGPTQMTRSPTSLENRPFQDFFSRQRTGWQKMRKATGELHPD